MKYLLIITFLITPMLVNAQSKKSDYTVRHRCQGPSKFAMVVDYDGQNYVMVSTIFFQNDWVIEDLTGLSSSGGILTMTYKNSSGSSARMRVEVISRSRFGYSGAFGARDICRQVARDTYNFSP